MSTFLSREQMLAIPDLTTEVVEVEEWQCAVRVRSLNVQQRGEVEAVLARCKDADGRVADPGRFYAALVIAGVVDESGKPVFAKSDRDTLLTKNSAACARIADAVVRLAGLSPVQAAVDAKNSESDPSADSSST